MKRFLLSLLVVIYWGVGFAPFHWVSPVSLHNNGVQVTQQGQLTFPRPGIAYTQAPPAWVQAAIQDTTFEVEIMVCQPTVSRECFAHRALIASSFA